MNNKDIALNDFFIKTRSLSIPKLLNLAIKEKDEDKYWTIIGAIQSRGSLDVFNKAKKFSQSKDSIKRQVAADILGQLRTGKDRLYHQESVEILLDLLHDNKDDVIASAAFSLGHRNDKKAIEPLLLLIKHKNPFIRAGVVSGLSNHEDKRAIRGLIQLTKNSDYDVQNWAVFGLASQCDTDSEEIRTALFKQLNNEDAEIRGEAMIGLAKRKDKRVKKYIVKELKNLTEGSWVLEAIAEMPHSSYASLLQTLIEKMITQYEFERHIDEAKNVLKLCKRV